MATVPASFLRSAGMFSIQVSITGVVVFVDITIKLKNRCLWLAIAWLVVLTGCGQAPPPQFARNEVEWLKQEKMYFDGESFEPAEKQEIDELMLALFGTPEVARFPFQASAEPLVEPAQLALAAGAVQSDQQGVPQGLFREHCSQCHSITGSGAGPAAQWLSSYPRDFRMGKFKFKSTPMGHPPTDQDLKQVLIKGIPGTAMPSFRLLPDEELEALVDYVKYLSIRGQYERYLIAELAGSPDLTLFDDRLAEEVVPESVVKFDPAAQDHQAIKNFETQPLESYLTERLGEQFQQRVLDRWRNAEQVAVEVPAVPSNLDPADPGFADLVAAGKQLFHGKGTCNQCHGENGSGLGEQVNYDDWTNDWLKSPGVDPDDRSTWKEFKQAGALRPRQAQPRNLSLGVYRGGGRPADLFLRIDQGIEGSPMPAATALTDDEIWALVAYVYWLADLPQLPADSAEQVKP